jgi:hypothetical protein
VEQVSNLLALIPPHVRIPGTAQFLENRPYLIICAQLSLLAALTVSPPSQGGTGGGSLCCSSSRVGKHFEHWPIPLGHWLNTFHAFEQVIGRANPRGFRRIFASFFDTRSLAHRNPGPRPFLICLSRFRAPFAITFITSRITQISRGSSIPDHPAQYY